MFRITKAFEFDAAHRLFRYEGLCANVHGHRYRVEVSIEGHVLDEMGMFVDFKELDKWVNEIIHCWDHAFLLNKDDPLKRVLGGDNKVVLFNGNPTAENMAARIYLDVQRVLFQQCDKQRHRLTRLAKVRVYETPECWAEFWSPMEDGDE